MAIDYQIKDEKFNIILTEKLQNRQPYHQAKLKSINILHAKKYYLLIKNK